MENRLSSYGSAPVLFQTAIWRHGVFSSFRGIHPSVDENRSEKAEVLLVAGEVKERPSGKAQKTKPASMRNKKSKTETSQDCQHNCLGSSSQLQRCGACAIIV